MQMQADCTKEAINRNWALFKGGNNLAFASVYDCIGDRVYTQLKHLAKDSEISMDAFQHAFEKLLNYEKPIDDVAAFLYTTGSNKIKDIWRREKRLVNIDEIKDVYSPIHRPKALRRLEQTDEKNIEARILQDKELMIWRMYRWERR